MVPPDSQNTSIKYRDMFSPLIELNQDSDILSIVQEQLDQKPSSSSSSFLSNFFSPAPPSSSKVEIEKLFRIKMGEWIRLLDQCLDSNRFNPIELPEFQEAVQPIYVDGKTEILKHKLQKKGLLSEKTEQKIQKLNKFLLRVIKAPHLKQIVHANSISTTSLPPIGKSIFFETHPPAPYAVKKVTPIDPAEIHREMMERAHQTQIKRKAKEISLYNLKWGEGWEDRIIEAISEVDKEDVIKELGCLLTPIQVIEIFQYFLENSPEDWKIAFLFCSLNADTLIEVLPSFEATELDLIKTNISQEAEKNREWFDEAVKNQAKSMQKGCKEVEGKVDALTVFFKKEDQFHEINRNVQEMDETALNLKLRLTAICEKLAKIYDRKILEEKVFETLFSEVPKRYELLYKRLTAIEGAEENLVWSSIYDKTFGTARLDDDDDATEVLREWSIFYPVDYWKSGLFGDITEPQFDKLSEQCEPWELYKLGADNLSYLEIKQISDWKRLKIFNAITLRNYLIQQDVAKKLRAQSLEFLGN